MSCYGTHYTCREILGSNQSLLHKFHKASFGSTKYFENDTSIKFLLYIKCKRPKQLILMRRKLVLEVGEKEHDLSASRDS